jgi:hypothetical protein
VPTKTTSCDALLLKFEPIWLTIVPYARCVVFQTQRKTLSRVEISHSVGRITHYTLHDVRLAFVESSCLTSYTVVQRELKVTRNLAVLVRRLAFLSWYFMIQGQSFEITLRIRRIRTIRTQPSIQDCEYDKHYLL